MKKIIIDVQKNNLNIITFEGINIHNSVIETTAHIHKKTNIYKGIVTSIKYNIESAFVDYGTNKCGLIPISELLQKHILPTQTTEQDNNQNIILAQIVKEEKNNKGVTLTTNISLVGYHLILLPKSIYKIGISKKISNDNRKQLRETTKNLNIPTPMGIIVRTNASKASPIELALDLNILIEQWLQIKQLFVFKKAPSILYQESNKIVQTIRDNVKVDICDIIINNKKLFKLALHYTKNLQENLTQKLTYFTPASILFKKFKLTEQQPASTVAVKLPSGGTVFIEKTEALVAIDVNSAKMLSKKNADSTALKTNLEATDEIARQLKLRNLSGLIVIDYIDMKNKKHNDLVTTRMLEATSYDTSKIKIGKISDFGLLELSRQQTGNVEKKIQQKKTKKLNTKILYNTWKKLRNKNNLQHTLIFIAPFTSEICFKQIKAHTQYIEYKKQKQILLVPKDTKENFYLSSSVKLKMNKNLYVNNL